MATYTNKNGTNNNDILTYNDKGTYHANKGNDTIKVTGGSVVIFTDGGNNTLTISGGSGHVIKVAATAAESDAITGVEQLTIDKADMVEAILGSGKDVVTLGASNGRKSDGSLAKIYGGAWGDTFNVNAGAQKYQLYGEAGNDEFNVKDGSNMVFWGGAGRDSFLIEGGSRNKYYGGDSEDRFEVYADNQTITLGYGGRISESLYDEVVVHKGDNQVIYGNLGINKITLNAGWGHTILADIDKALSKKNGYTDAQIAAGEGLGYGVDMLYINEGVERVKARLGDGADIVELQHTCRNHICTEGWGDSVKLMDSSLNLVYLGDGFDKLELLEKSYFNERSSSNYVNAGNGEDTIYAEGGYNIIYGGAGADEIKLYSGNSNRVYGGADGDIIEVFRADRSFVSGDAGDDSITLRGSKGCLVEGGSGNDKILLTEGCGYDRGLGNMVRAGSGNDFISVNCNRENNVLNGRQMYHMLFIDLVSDFQSGDANVLSFTNITAAEGEYVYDKGKDILRMYNADAGTFYIQGLSRDPLISFGSYDEQSSGMENYTGTKLLQYITDNSLSYAETSFKPAEFDCFTDNGVEIASIANDMEEICPGTAAEIWQITGNKG